jgi:hypothetical protein
MIDQANNQVAEIERFYEENNVEEMLQEYMGEYDYEMLYFNDEEMNMMKNEIATVQEWVDSQPQCMMPQEVAGAMDWALDQLDMCNSSATTFLIGASTLLVASIAF